MFVSHVICAGICLPLAALALAARPVGAALLFSFLASEGDGEKSE